MASKPKSDKTRATPEDVQKIQTEVDGGKDIVAIAAGAKSLVSFEEALEEHVVARLFAVPKPKRGRPSKYDPSWMIDSVIETGRIGGSRDKMAAKLGISKDTLYKWAEEHPDFSDAIKEGSLLAKVWWENFGQSAALGMVDGFNATTWIFQMKNRFPETYRDVKVTELNSNQPLIDARTVVINARELSPEYRQSLKLALLAAKKLVEGDADE